MIRLWLWSWRLLKEMYRMRLSLLKNFNKGLIASNKKKNITIKIHLTQVKQTPLNIRSSNFNLQKKMLDDKN